MPTLAVRQDLKPLLPLTAAEQAALEGYERTIESGKQAFIDVGTALAAVRDGRLYRAEYPDFQTYCVSRWGIGASRGRQLISAANVARLLESVTAVTLENEAQARELVPFIGGGLEAFWQTVVETAPTKDGSPHVTAAHIKSVASVVGEIATQQGMDTGDGVIVPFRQLLNHRITEETAERFARQTQHVRDKMGLVDGDEWRTPDGAHLDAVRRLFEGRIDLDPCSTPEANNTIKARRYYTKADDGLKSRWSGYVFLNPPFSYPLVEQFTARAISLHEAQKTKGTIILVNNATDTDWFQSLLGRYLNCFPRGRILFNHPERNSPGSRQGQTFFYMGDNEAGFISEFSELGTVTRTVTQ